MPGDARIIMDKGERQRLADLYPPEKRPSASCAERFGGYCCTRRKHGNHGPHVAHNSRLEAIAIEVES